MPNVLNTATAVVHHGDALEALAALPGASIDSVVTDPPYALEFMGKAWDAFDGGDAPGSFQHWCQLWAAECLRILKPGGHLLAFGGTRTWHRLTAGIEDAGFEIRDSIAWMYGSGFPKSMDVSKAIDKAAGVQFSAKPASGVGFMNAEGAGGYNVTRNQLTREGEQTPDAKRWQGWGTALKPAFEPIVVARKPLVGTVAVNVLAHGTGALNIDASRIGTEDETARVRTRGAAMPGDERTFSGQGAMYAPGTRFESQTHPSGRWPANVILDESQAVALDEQTADLQGATSRSKRPDRSPFTSGSGNLEPDAVYGDTGGASRFFYVAKAPARERVKANDGTAHPTVKPLTLMRYLVRLVTPPGGIVLDPFAGSGTTLEAILAEGFRGIAIEREAEYLPLILQRVERARA